MIPQYANSEDRNHRLQGVQRLLRLSLVIALLQPGCVTSWKGQSPTAAGLKPSELVDPTAYGPDGPPPPVFRKLFDLGEKLRESQRPAVLPPKRSVLVLSGGGSYGAFTAGVLCGWTETGTRPQFDVVTGVSTGALISVFAFLGSDQDGELCSKYTSVTSADIYRKKPLVLAAFSDALNDTEPLRFQIDSTITPTIVQRLADAHMSGRRLYIGTTDLDGRRPVVWDLGAIAASGKPDRRDLICKLLLASAAIPGFFPSVEIPVDIDGRHYLERHVDGGLTQPLFFRPPYIRPDQHSSSLADLFYGSDEYVIVAGKLYADPEPVRPGLLKIIDNSVTTFIHAQTRDALVKLYMQSMITGMNYHLATIPGDYNISFLGTDFDPVEMSKLFELGRNLAHSGSAWRRMPPGVGGGEELLLRAGTSLTVVPHVPKPVTMPSEQGDMSVPPEPQNLPAAR